VEPYVVAATRTALAQLDSTDPSTAAAARGYMAQESKHHAQHRRFNDLVRNKYARVEHVERWMARTYAWLEHTRSVQFSVAFAAGFETISYSAARWIEPQMDELFAGADPVTTSLFLWHLAEEVEHKGVAYDVHRAIGGSRRLYVGAMLTALVLLAWFTTLGALIILAGERRLWKPISWFRITRWLLSFLFHAGPIMMMSATRAFHPANLVDPPRLVDWLAGYDSATGTLPVFEPLAA
jgi:uncharacterized protein